MRSICPHDLLARGRIRRNGPPHKPLAQTAKVDPQIAEIILGEVRGVEARTLLDSFNTIHSGSLAAIHANSADEALCRFANLVMRGHAQTTSSDTETEIGEAVDFVARLERNREGEPFGKCCDSMVMTDGQSSSGLKPYTPVNQAPFRGASTMSKCQEIARRFLSKSFRSEGTFALLARYLQASCILQRSSSPRRRRSARQFPWNQCGR